MASQPGLVFTGDDKAELNVPCDERFRPAFWRIFRRGRVRQTPDLNSTAADGTKILTNRLDSTNIDYQFHWSCSGYCVAKKRGFQLKRQHQSVLTKY